MVSNVPFLTFNLACDRYHAGAIAGVQGTTRGGVGGGCGEEGWRAAQVLVQQSQKRVRVEGAYQVLPRSLQRTSQRGGQGGGGHAGADAKKEVKHIFFN